MNIAQLRRLTGQAFQAHLLGELTKEELKKIIAEYENDFKEKSQKILVRADHPTFRRIDDRVSPNELQGFIKEIERLGYENIEIVDNE